MLSIECYGSVVFFKNLILNIHSTHSNATTDRSKNVHILTLFPYFTLFQNQFGGQQQGYQQQPPPKPPDQQQMQQQQQQNGGGAFGFMKNLMSSNSSEQQLNKKNVAQNGVIPYGDDYSSYYDEGWYQDDYGEWHQDPSYAKQGSTTSGYVVNTQQSQQQQSSYVVSDSNQNQQQTNTGSSRNRRPDNYEEGWYQDDNGEWLNEFDWHQDESGEWYYEDSYDYEADGWKQDENGEWYQDSITGVGGAASRAQSMFKNISDLGGLFGASKKAAEEKALLEEKKRILEEQVRVMEEKKRQETQLQHDKQELEKKNLELEADKLRHQTQARLEDDLINRNRYNWQRLTSRPRR